MNAEDHNKSSITHRSHKVLLFIEWLSLLSGILLCLPAGGYYPGLLLALPLMVVSWGARSLRIHRLSRSTPLDIPLLLFLLSLLVSYVVAYDPATAFARLTLFLTAISFYYSLVNSPIHVVDRILSLLMVVLTLGSLFLIAQVDWLLEPVRFPTQTSIGVLLNSMIPDLGINLPAWNAMRNIFASLLGLFLPILVLKVIRSIQYLKQCTRLSREWYFASLKLFLLIITGLLLILDMILTESRAPWLVYAAIAGMVAWWWFSRRIEKRISIPRHVIFPSGVLLACLLIIIAMSLRGEYTDLSSLLPGPDTLTGRLEIYPQSYYLAGDTPFTGTGLGTFTAHYSFYINNIPFNAFLNEDTGNNLYLYVLVEQGWLGLLCLVILLVSPLIIGLIGIDRSDIDDKGLVAVGIIGLGVILLRGFIHAVLGSSRAIPLLLLPTGLVFAGLGSLQQGLIQDMRTSPFRNIRSSILIFSIPLLFLFIYLLFAPSPRSAWYANLGSVRMASIQLAGWPTEKWEDGSSLPLLVPAETMFQRSIILNPRNFTANYRMGLIALLRQEFPAAEQYLDAAYRENPHHRGVIKSLGYTRVWMGKIEDSLELLRMIPEAPQELEAYVLWWQNLGYPEISAQADEARDSLLAIP